MFQQRHYEAVAKAIRRTATRNDLISALIEVFEADNPKFKYARFMQAAYGGSPLQIVREARKPFPEGVTIVRDAAGTPIQRVEVRGPVSTSEPLTTKAREFSMSARTKENPTGEVFR